MSLWKSDRFEYLRQPHIIAALLLAAAIVGLAVYTGVNRLHDRDRLLNLPTAEACTELVGDADLCRFAAVSEAAANSPYTSTTTSVSDSGKTTIVHTVAESPDRMRTIAQEDGRETSAFMLLDADNYVRDYADSGIWAHYRDETFEPLASTIEKYDFSTATSQDVLEFRDGYKRQGEEPCDDRVCLKYEITSDDEGQIFVWFDTDEFRLRRYQLFDETGTHTTQYSYEPVTLLPPTPVKEVDEETFITLLGSE